MAYTRVGADSLAEHLTGAASDGGAQNDPALALGHFRSATEVESLGFIIDTPIPGLTLHFASGGNPVGPGLLTAVSTTELTWKPFGAGEAGPAITVTGDDLIPAKDHPEQFLRVSCTTPLQIGSSVITLSEIIDNYFGFPTLSIAQASAGIIQHRASIVRNLTTPDMTLFKRWIATLGTSQLSNVTHLGASGSGTLQTSGSFSTWPTSGWCQVRNSVGVLKEVVYYESRTATVLTVSATGRALLDTSATAGASDDRLHPVPGIALAIDSAGVTAGGLAIQTIAGAVSAPTGVTWNLGITSSTGLQIGTMTAGQQVGIWMKRHCPAGMKASPSVSTRINDSFSTP